MTEIAHYIGGVRVAGTSGRSQPVTDPATGDAEKTVALASKDEVETAIASAHDAWVKWSKTPPLRRAHSRPVQDDPVGARRPSGRRDLCRARQDA